MQINDRVQLHPATTAWMMGDRFGEIVKITKKYIHVLMDRSGRTLKVTRNNIGEVLK